VSVCARCHRPLTRPPVVVAGHGYGPSCAAKVGDLLTQLVRSGMKPRTPRRRKNEKQLALLEVQP
jgi:hypothetical protein